MNGRMYNKQNSRPTIAYLAPTISGSNDLVQWSGVVDAVQRHEVNLICLPGWSLRDPRGFNSQANVLYDLVTPENIDGIVSWASSLGNYTDLDTITAFHSRYHPLPIVTIGRKLKGSPVLMMDSYVGMREAIVHLIEGHGFRRLVFIRGPENHFYAQERYRAYTETLEEYGIPFDANLVTQPSDWSRSTGMEVMTILLDERNLRPQADFEAVVSANDDLLLGALGVLHERGIHVPGEVGATGFNNTLEARTNSPSLTTVAVPFYDMGYRAVEMLLALMAGEQVAEKVLMPSKLKVRRSCGCLDPVLVNAAPDIVQPQKAVLSEVVQNRKIDILADMTRAMDVNGSHSHYSQMAERLVDSFFSQMEGSGLDTFLTTLEDVLTQTMIANTDSTISLGQTTRAWHEAISGLRRSTLPYLNNGFLPRAENLWQQSRVLIGDVAQKAQKYETLRIEQRNQLLHEIGASLISTFDVAELVQILAGELPALGIPSAYLSLYEQAPDSTFGDVAAQATSAPDFAPQWSRMILAYSSEEGLVELPDDGLRFPSHQLVPEGMWPLRPFRYIAKPLYFQDRQIGLALFEIAASGGRIYEALQEQLSSALQGALLMQQVRFHAAQLDTAVTETVATIQELQTASAGTAERAKLLAEVAQESLDVSQEGRKAVTDSIAGMELILQRTEATVQQIEILAERTQQVREIIEVVKDIADQSKLLALNARIQAAQVRNEGRGFAVVAREMRFLAELSNEATSRVREILTEIQVATNTAVDVSKEGSQSAEQGVVLVGRAGEAINALASTIQEASQAAVEIAAITHKQDNGMNQLLKEMLAIQQSPLF